VYKSGEREYRAAFFPRLKFARWALPSRSGIPDAANHRVDTSIYRIFDSRIARESWTFIGSTLIAERARVTSRLNRKTERERERDFFRFSEYRISNNSGRTQPRNNLLYPPRKFLLLFRVIFIYTFTRSCRASRLNASDFAMDESRILAAASRCLPSDRIRSRTMSAVGSAVRSVCSLSLRQIKHFDFLPRSCDNLACRLSFSFPQ